MEDCDTSPVTDVEDCDTSPVADVEDCEISPVVTMEDCDALTPVISMEDCDALHDNKDTDVSEQFLTKISEILQSAENFFELTEKWEMLKQFANTYPHIALFILILSAMSLVPSVCFCIFALTTSVVLLVSGLFLEAILLSFGMAVLLGVVAFLGLVSLAMTFCVSIAYYSVSLAQRLINKRHLTSAEAVKIASNTKQRTE